MIRIASIEHVDQGVELLKDYVKEFDFGQFKDNNSEYYKELLTQLVKDKTVIVSENDGKIDGVLLGARIPNLLNPNEIQLHVLLTWVHPDKRGSSIFYRMNKMLEDKFGKIDKIYYSIPETNINHNKLGYRKFQTMYIKEKM